MIKNISILLYALFFGLSWNQNAELITQKIKLENDKIMIIQKINFKKSQLDQSAQLKFSLFFFFMYLILASNLPMGKESWLSDLLKLSGFLRFHNVDRANMFFHFFSLAAAIFGLSYVLNLKKWSYFNYIFLGYLLILTIVYFAMPKLPFSGTPSSRLDPGPLHPDNLLMEITVLFTIYTYDLINNFEGRFNFIIFIRFCFNYYSH